MNGQLTDQRHWMVLAKPLEQTGQAISYGESCQSGLISGQSFVLLVFPVEFEK